ncbi:hypothetical protein Tco_0843951, partial [Tanacetum coccineum]
SPVALSPGYVEDSDPEEDPEEDHADYPANGGDDDDEPFNDDDDDDIGDEDEEPFEDEEDHEEEEEHLALADSSAVPITDPVPSAEDTKALETDEAAPTPVPSPRRHTARMFVRPQTPVPLPSEAEVERLIALPIPPPSPLTALSSPLPQIPSPPLPPPPSSLHLPPPIPTSLPLPLSPLPLLPALLFIPPVDRREDTPEADLPPRKRLCLTAPAPRYAVGESSTTAPRPMGLSTLWMPMSDEKEPRRSAMALGMFRQTQIYQRVDILAGDRQFHYETARLLDQEAPVSREAWAHSIGLSLAVHYELQAYRTHTQMQGYRIASHESLMTTLITHVSSLQGQFSSALGHIQALRARGQTHVDDREGAASTTNNMPPRRSSATARAAAAAATPMTVAAVKQLIEARVSAALANHDTL